MLKTEVKVIAVILLLFVMCIYFGYGKYDANRELKRVSAQNDTLTKEKEMMFINSVKRDSIKTLKPLINIDSANLYKKTIDLQRKNNALLYQQKLNESKQINTHAKRSSYCDSIERAIRDQRIIM